MTVALTMVLIAFAVLAALQSWRRGLACFAVWIVCEDFVRKSSGNDVTLYLAKDVLLLAIYASFFLRELRRPGSSAWRRMVMLPAAVVFSFALAQAFNPDLGHPLVAVIGLRMSFIYIPLMLVAYHYVSDERSLTDALRLITCLGALAAIAGLLQSVVGIELFNPAATPGNDLVAQRQTLDGSRFFRPNSVFLDSSRFGLFLFTSLFLSVGYLFFEASRRGSAWWRRLTMLNVLLIGSALLFNGYRAALVGVVLAAPALFLCRRWNEGASGRHPVWKLAVVLLVGATVFGSLFHEQIDPVLQFYRETLFPSSSSFEGLARLRLQGNNFTTSLLRSGVLGHGTGSASQGLYYLASFLYGDPYALMATEGLYSAIVWEYGVVGLLLWGWWLIALVWFEWRRIQALRGTRYYGLGFTIALWSTVFLFVVCPAGMQVFQDYLSNAALWFCAGVIGRLPMLAGREAVAAVRPVVVCA